MVIAILVAIKIRDVISSPLTVLGMVVVGIFCFIVSRGGMARLLGKVVRVRMVTKELYKSDLANDAYNRYTSGAQTVFKLAPVYGLVYISSGE